MKAPAAIGILAALKPKSSGGSYPSKDEEEPPASEAGESENEYGSELASMLGVSEEDTADFNRALKGFVQRCIATSKTTEE